MKKYEMLCNLRSGNKFYPCGVIYTEETVPKEVKEAGDAGRSTVKVIEIADPKPAGQVAAEEALKAAKKKITAAKTALTNAKKKLAAATTLASKLTANDSEEKVAKIEGALEKAVELVKTKGKVLEEAIAAEAEIQKTLE